MRRFSPTAARAAALGGVARSYLTLPPCEGSLGSQASGILNYGMQCIVVGLETEGEALVRKSLGLVEQAIKVNEKDRHYTPAQRHETRAWCLWLLNDRHAAEDWDAFAEGRLRFYQEEPKVLDKTELILGLADFVAARRCDVAQALCDACKGFRPPSSNSTS